MKREKQYCRNCGNVIKYIVKNQFFKVFCSNLCRKEYYEKKRDKKNKNQIRGGSLENGKTNNQKSM